MKTYSLVILFAFFLSACSTDDENLAAKVEGIYVTTSVTSNGKSLTLTQHDSKTHIALQTIDALHVRVLAEMDSVSGIPSFETTGTLSNKGQGITLIMEDENVATIHQGKMRMYLIKRDNTLLQIDATRE